MDLKLVCYMDRGNDDIRGLLNSILVFKVTTGLGGVPGGGIDSCVRIHCQA